MQSLQRLYQITLEEREAARELDMDRLMRLLEEKQELLPELENAGQLTGEERELADSILQENRRNAYFFNSALSWTQENLEFLKELQAAPAYGGEGNKVTVHAEGNIISGKV
jgi:flagellar biosynthesis/type III secretory pathway chaperone